MVSVPAKIPVTTPELFIVANDGLLLLQVPPVVVSVRDTVLPIHTVVVPLGGVTTGTVLTVRVAVAAVLPQVLVKV